MYLPLLSFVRVHHFHFPCDEMKSQTVGQIDSYVYPIWNSESNDPSVGLCYSSTVPEPCVVPGPTRVKRPQHNVVQYVVRQIIFVTTDRDRVRNCSAYHVSETLESRVGTPTILNLVQRLHSNPLLLRQLPRVNCEGPQIRLALAYKRANGVCGGSATLAWKSGDGVTHQFSREVGHAEQIVFDRQREILHSIRIRREHALVSHCLRIRRACDCARGYNAVRCETRKKEKRTGEPDLSDRRCWTCSQVTREACVR